MNTISISCRLTAEERNDILIECEKIGLNISDLIRLKIAKSSKYDDLKKRIIFKIKQFRRVNTFNISNDCKDFLDQLILLIEEF